MKISWVFISLFIVLASYTGSWFWASGEIRKQIDVFYEQAEENNIEITGAKPAINGFPGKHKIRFSGKVEIAKLIIEIPDLLVKGIFMPGQDIDITLGTGLALKGILEPETWSINYGHVNFTIPEDLPQTTDREDIAIWQENDGEILVNTIRLEKRELKATGNGFIKLDQQLQPVGELSLRVSGDYMGFLSHMKKTGIIETKEVLLAGTILAGLTRKDEETGENYIDLNLALQNRSLLLGPLRIAKMGRIQWSWRSHPDPHQ